MATIGLKYPVYSKIVEDELTGTVSYEAGKIMGKAISFRSTLDVAETPLYADDGVAENANEFSGGRLTVNVDDLLFDVQADIFGHEVKENEIDGETVVELIKKGGDISAYIGVGAYATKVRSGKKFFRALFFSKVQFGPPAETFETKEKTIRWQTPTMEGTIMQDINGCWGTEVTVDKEDLARAWLRKKVHIVSP